MTQHDFSLAIALRQIEQANHAREVLLVVIDRLAMEGVPLDTIENAFDDALEELTGGFDWPAAGCLKETK